MAATSPAELENFHYGKMGGQPIKMIAAAGPYTLSDNLLFEPFAALMQHVNKERPDVLLLVSIKCTPDSFRGTREPLKLRQFLTRMWPAF